LTPVITIEFEAPMNRASINAKSIMIFGRWAGVMPGEFRFEDSDRRIRFFPAQKLSAGELVTVAVSRQVKSAAGDSLAAGYTWNFWTATGRGSMTLQLTGTLPVRFAGEPPVRTYGAYAGDLNGDGYHDFTVPNEDANDIRIYHNDGKGNYSYFARQPLTAPARPSTNEGADFSGDGLTDFAVGNIRGNAVSVLFGDGRGGLQAPSNYPVDREPRGLSVMDLEGDGDMDIVTANRAGSNISILRNKGDGTFEASVPLETGAVGETACVAADANEDGILDLFVGAYGSKEIVLLLGDGKGGLSFAKKISCGGSPWMVAAGDVDGDGHVDVVAANALEARAVVIRGDGHGDLLPAESYPVGSFPLAIDLGDLNGDGDLDLITSNYDGADWTLYENSGNGEFVRRESWLSDRAGSCAVLHDRDLDGDLDMTGIDEEADMIYLFENVSPTSVHEDYSTAVPHDFSLAQIYPNPAARRSNINISFALHRTAKANLRVVNVLGQTVRVLVDGILSAGSHQTLLNAQELHAGVYCYILCVDGKTLVGKFVIL
jgi:hypothetical protein